MTADQKIKDALALLRDPYSGFNQADFDGAIRTNIESLLLEHEEAFVRIAELEAWECRMLAQEEIDVAMRGGWMYTSHAIALQRKFAEVNGLKVKS